MIHESEPQSEFTGVPLPRITPLVRTSGLSLSTLGTFGLGLTLLTSATSARAQNFDPRCSDRTATGYFDCAIARPIVDRPEFVYPNVMFAPGDTVRVNADGCVQTSDAFFGSGDTWKRYVNPGGDGSESLYHGLIRIPTARLAGTDVGNSLTRIKRLIGRPFTVTGEGVPTSELVLHLGYEDDPQRFNDNSYDRHDDGTEDQCKTDGVHDGGPAHVTVTICRGVPCGPTTSRFDFDVLSSWVDPNGFLMNPHWSWEDRPQNRGKTQFEHRLLEKFPSTSLCHEFSKHDTGRPWYSPNFPDCTDQADLGDVDVPFGINWTVCTANKVFSRNDLVPAYPAGILSSANSLAGHVNWFPITIEGQVYNVVREQGDDDYDFSLLCDGDSQGSLYTNARPYMHVEFDSDETIDHFTSEQWRKLHDAVNDSEDKVGALGSCDSSESCGVSQRAQLQKDVDDAHTRVSSLFRGHTIMTGMFGLDGEHELKSELHPLYAMATRLDCENDQCSNCGNDQCKHDLSDENWLIFVRNTGDEGYCSEKSWDGGFEDYTFRLPWQPGMTSVEVNWDKTQFQLSAGTSMKPPVVVPPPLTMASGVAPPSASRLGPTAGRGDLTASAGAYAPVTGGDAGVYVTFHLGSQKTSPFIDGALHLRWSGPTSSPGRTAAGILARPAAAETSENNDVEQKLGAAISHLPGQQRKAVQKARIIPSQPVVVRRMAPGGHVDVLPKAPVTGVMARSAGTHAPISGPARPATRKLARDGAQMHALCAASNNAPYGLPAEVCKANVRDHRTTPAADHR